jgi:hypothetical protein
MQNFYPSGYLLESYIGAKIPREIWLFKHCNFKIIYPYLQLVEYKTEWSWKYESTAMEIKNIIMGLFSESALNFVNIIKENFMHLN